jgi:glycosyltransferase involved in cell wall biosynthesis
LAVDPPAAAGARLAIYVDDVYRLTRQEDAARVSVDRAFLLFACHVGREFADCRLIGRAVVADDPADYAIPDDIGFVPLPYYASLYQLGAVARAVAGTVATMWRCLADVDVVWTFGPHPFALILAILARGRRKRVVLGVRQNTMSYHRSRLPNRRWRPALLGVWLLESAFRWLGRGVSVTAVGAAAAARYGAPNRRVLDMTVSLVRASQIPERPRSACVEPPIALMTVGRLDSEKNPLLLVDALRRLDGARPGRYRLTWIGRGPLEQAVREQAAAAAVANLIEFRGYVPFGDELLDLYRQADLLVHVSLTEGVPQVVLEALAMGLPVVASDVGSVADLLEQGAAGLLVPADDAFALVEAVERLSNDAALRGRVVERGLAVARRHTLELEATRTARFVAGVG